MNGTEEGDHSEGNESETYVGSEISIYAEDEMTVNDWFSANAGFRAVLFESRERHISVSSRDWPPVSRPENGPHSSFRTPK